MTYASAGGTSENSVCVNNQYSMCSVLSVGSYEVNGSRPSRLCTSEAVIPERSVCHWRAKSDGAVERGDAHAEITHAQPTAAINRAVDDI
jgi:hypothetical protein